MRHFAALLLGGVFSMAVVLANCDARQTSPSPSVDAGPDVSPLDALQACIEACDLMWTHCGQTGTCESYCEKLFQDVPPECMDEFIGWATCELAFQQTTTMPPNCTGQFECDILSVYRCIEDYGCVKPPPRCDPDSSAECNCRETCQHIYYQAVCRPDGMTSTCDCFIESTAVGTCDGGPYPYCKREVNEGCCNQFFMLPF
jgi:hypothetical protein